MSPHWLIPHFAQVAVIAFVVIVLILTLGNFQK